MGAPVPHVALLKAQLMREVATQTDQAITRTQPDIHELVNNLTQRHGQLHPDIEVAMRTFAQRYHVYLTQNEAVIAANNFRQNLFRSLSTLPQEEVLHMANKVITAISHMFRPNAKDIYDEVLDLVNRNPKSEKSARTFHFIIDMYVDKITSGERLLDSGSMDAWVMLDKMAEILTTDEEYLYGKDPRTLNANGRRIQAGIKMIIEGIQKRNTATIRSGFRYHFLRRSELGEVAHQLIWDIERRLH